MWSITCTPCQQLSTLNQSFWCDIHFKAGEPILWNKNKQTVGIGKVINRLYLLDAQAELPGLERANLASTQKLSWDQWHWRYGHLSMGVLEKLKKQEMVKGLMVDESLIPSQSCEACIQARQAHWPFPKEANSSWAASYGRCLGTSPCRINGQVEILCFTHRWCQVICHDTILWTKDQAQSWIKEHVNMIEKKYMQLLHNSQWL